MFLAFSQSPINALCYLFLLPIVSSADIPPKYQIKDFCLAFGENDTLMAELCVSHEDSVQVALFTKTYPICCTASNVFLSKIFFLKNIFLFVSIVCTLFTISGFVLRRKVPAKCFENLPLINPMSK